MGAQRVQIGAQGVPKNERSRKSKKRTQKVEKLKNHENLKNSKVKMLIFHSFYNEN